MDNESYMEIDGFGNKTWKNKKGLLHRLDGPAVEQEDGTKAWFQNGKLHREDGPAAIHFYGTKEWWLNDIFYKTKEEYFDNLSDEAKTKCLFSKDFLNV